MELLLSLSPRHVPPRLGCQSMVGSMVGLTVGIGIGAGQP